MSKTPHTFSIFGQDTTGTHWICNTSSVEDAEEMIEKGDFDEKRYEALFVMPVTLFVQFNV